jgi:hypothetical protein
MHHTAMTRDSIFTVKTRTTNKIYERNTVQFGEVHNPVEWLGMAGKFQSTAKE